MPPFKDMKLDFPNFISEIKSPLMELFNGEILAELKSSREPHDDGADSVHFKTGVGILAVLHLMFSFVCTKKKCGSMLQYHYEQHHHRTYHSYLQRVRIMKFLVLLRANPRKFEDQF